MHFMRHIEREKFNLGSATLGAFVHCPLSQVTKHGNKYYLHLKSESRFSEETFFKISDWIFSNIGQLGTFMWNRNRMVMAILQPDKKSRDEVASRVNDIKAVTGVVDLKAGNKGTRSECDMQGCLPARTDGRCSRSCCGRIVNPAVVSRQHKRKNRDTNKTCPDYKKTCLG